jgi:hypothetical protein
VRFGSIVSNQTFPNFLLAERPFLTLLDRSRNCVAGALPLPSLKKTHRDRERRSLKGVAQPKKVVLLLSSGNIDQANFDTRHRHHGG